MRYLLYGGGDGLSCIAVFDVVGCMGDASGTGRSNMGHHIRGQAFPAHSTDSMSQRLLLASDNLERTVRMT